MNSLFENLFVLELANNHLGSVARGQRIIEAYSNIVRANQVRAAIKLQLRDVERFIHQDFYDNEDIRYIRKTRSTKLSNDDYAQLINRIRECGCIPMATPFDEASVDLCTAFELPILKIASSCINDWPLIEKIAHGKKPVIVSNGGATLKDMDDIVIYFAKRGIPLAINHCVSIYPSEDNELELNQIDFLRTRYPDNTIGFSTHEYHDWAASIMIAYAKGARTFERHIDSAEDGVNVSAYCSLPEQIDVWFKSFKKAEEMCGAPGIQKRAAPEKEIRYLDDLVRGVYAKRDLPEGHCLSSQDIYAAIPLQAGQVSCREWTSGEVLIRRVKKDNPIMIDDIDSAYARNQSLKQLIYNRGLKHAVKN